MDIDVPCRDRDKITRIRNIMHNKKVVLIGNSPTVESLEQNREFFRDKSAIFVTMNNWLPIEEHILKPIGKLLDVISVGTLKRYRKQAREASFRNDIMIVGDKILDFSGFNQQNVFSLKCIHPKRCPIGHKCKDYSVSFPGWENFVFPGINSIYILTALISIGNPKSIFIFGCDGGRSNDLKKEQIDVCHYRCDEKCTNPLPQDHLIVNAFCVYEELMSHISKTFECPIPPIYLSGVHSRFKILGEKKEFSEVLRIFESY